MIGDIIFALIAMTISTAISLAFITPLFGALVRFRANYTPKGLALDGTPGQPHVGPVVTSYFQMLFRIKRIEGYSGYFKGMMPMAASVVLITIFSGLWVGSASLASPRAGKYAAPSSTIFELLVYTLFISLISVPSTIIVNRAITTPHKLPWFNPVFGLTILLTQNERSRPWVLFLTPGLVPGLLLHLCWVVLVLHSFRRLLLPSSFLVDGLSGEDGTPKWPADFTGLRFSLYFIILLISTPILCALEVITTRLSLQRNNAGSGFTAVPQDENAMGVADDDIEFAGLEEDVIGLRSEEDPYVGLADAAKRIYEEEGVSVLLRGWWITLLGGTLSVFG